jgi:hypothetical protein
MKTQDASEEASPDSCPSARLGRDEQCPLCGGDNRCRVAKGHLYKGPCWCHEITVPNHILSRLTEGRLEQVCLCRACLEMVARISRELGGIGSILAKIGKAVSERRAACSTEDFYFDENGNVVFTSAYHLKRGTCCGSGCRHCPY